MASDPGEDEAADPRPKWRLPDQLPPLSGWTRTLFLAVWGALFAFAAGVFVAGLPSAFALPSANPAVQSGSGRMLTRPC